MAYDSSVERYERPLTFQCGGDRLMGILHHVQLQTDLLVVIVVGGHQYRVGSHRQFVQLARAVAQCGIPVLRFDHRGYGDSEGELRRYWRIGPDIKAAIDAGTASTGASRVVLWGLCDAASAISFYAATDPRVAGLVMANPWVRSEETQSEAHVRSYYPRRLRQISFWRDLLAGRINLAKAAGVLSKFFRRRFSQRFATHQLSLDDQDLKTRVLNGVYQFRGDVLFLLSGDDITASEFRYAFSSSLWQERLSRKVGDMQTVTLDGADHTFSREGMKPEVERATISWIRQTFGRNS